MPLEVLGIDLDAVVERCGQGDGGLDIGRAQILHHDGGNRAVAGPDIDEIRVPAGSDGVVIDHGGEVHLFKYRQVIGLGIDQYPLAELPACQGMQALNRYFQALDHGGVVEPPDFVGVADGHALHPIAEQPFEGHGRSQGIRVGIDDDQHRVVTFKLRPKPL